MFSSWLGGVITDPALMQIPLDDHLVHRGHGVFDTCTLSGGNLYRLGIHMDRLLTSAALARIEHSWTKEDLIQMVMDTASQARVKEGAVRYWLTAGPGGFSPSPQECEEACFYCVIIDPVPLGSIQSDPMAAGIPEATVIDTPMKPPLLATIKSNNYLLNVLTHMEAVDRGGTFGVLVDEEGYVAESCVLNVVFVTKEGVLRTPPFDGILLGTTVRRIMNLAETTLIEEDLLSSVDQSPILASEVRGDAISEMFLCGGDTHLYPVTSWDQVPVGDGQVGSVAKRLIGLLEEEAFGTEAGESSDFIKVDYPD
tara:strand:+ start:1893 stop:2825 length:933 start_codon:yes stop_codon:yes gene_type:complete